MNALLIAFPYLETALIAAAFAALQTDHAAVWLIFIGAAALAACAAALIAAIRNALNGISAKQNLQIKGLQIPAYAVNFALAMLGVTMSVFGIGLILWTAALDAVTIVLTGISALGCGRKLLREGKITRGEAVWTTIGSFVYLADVGIAVLWRHREKRES